MQKNERRFKKIYRCTISVSTTFCQPPKGHTHRLSCKSSCVFGHQPGLFVYLVVVVPDG